jgi:glycosyltransferase involved in cell wall biosynthesis
MKNIYFFHWPSHLGGADTRLKDLIELFAESKKYNLFCIPNDNFRLEEENIVNFLEKNNVKILTWETLPEKTDGYAIAFCNFRLFQESQMLEKIRNIGLKFIWSNDMMWSSQEEVNAIEKNLVSAVIFTSNFHQNHLTKINPFFKKVHNYIIPNYFHSENYIKTNKKQHLLDKFVIGKLSRAEWTKYSENFPLFYKNIKIPNAHFRFMGWDEKLNKKYSWFEFGDSFELLKEKSETILDFLSQLDLYVFTCHHNYIENQSRSIIEAQLMGVPCIVPNEGNFPNMVWHERSGFIYKNIEECYEYISELYNNKNLLKMFQHNCQKITKLIWSDKKSQLDSWENLFNLL